MAKRLLHQFPVSHYCEKVRWVLDYKGLPYRIKNLLPGVHRFQAKRLAGCDTVPVLVDGSHAVGDSSEIALYLDDQYPDPPLIPTDPQQRTEVLAIQKYFDEHVGPPVRRWWYSYATRDMRLFKRTFFGQYRGAPRVFGELLAGPVAKQIANMYKVGGDGRDQSSRAIETAVNRLEELIEGDPKRYLVGPSFTLADLTAASLLGPLVAPAELPWTQEIDVPDILARREAMRARPAGRWLLARYAQERARKSVPLTA